MDNEFGLDVLNCDRGHLSIKFDKDNKNEVERAKDMVEDMLKRGYTIVVEYNGETHRVDKFDRKHGEYLVQDGPKKGKKGRPKGIPMQKAKATGIGRTAGG